MYPVKIGGYMLSQSEASKILGARAPPPPCPPGSPMGGLSSPISTVTPPMLFGMFTSITCHSSVASACVGDCLTPPTDWRSRQDPVSESGK